jgi:hypothetical protein
MQAVIMHPAGIASGLASAEARRHVADVAPDEVEQIINRSRALTAVERLEIYGRAYYARLLECLREEYPVLAQTAGEELFDDFAIGYLQEYPSRSYTLNHLGRNLPRYLAETWSREGSDEALAAGWPEFLIDLATLEWVYSEVFDGPGWEGQSLLSADQLLAIPPDRWPEARLVFVDCFRLLALRYPVHEYYSAVRAEEEAVPAGPAETLLAITRRNYTVRRHPLSRPQYDLLDALYRRETVGQAIARVAGPDLDALAHDLRQWFSCWSAEGFFKTVQLPEPPCRPLPGASGLCPDYPG